MGTQPSALDLAKQGNPRAIAALLNRSIQTHGIKALVRRKGDCLHIVLDAAQVPKQQTMVRYISSNLAKLEMTSINTVKIYGRQLGQDFPAWNNALVLSAQNAPNSSTPTLESHPVPPKTQVTAKATISSKPIKADQMPTGKTELAPSSQVDSRSHEVNLHQPSIQSVKFPNLLGLGVIAALMIQISFDALLAIFSLAQFIVSGSLDILNSSEGAGISIKLPILTGRWLESLWDPLHSIDIGFLGVTTTLFLVWLYRLQVRLTSAFPECRITPWGAVARFALPFYNCWGIWNLLTTIANHLKSWGQTTRLGIALQRWAPGYYAAWLISWTLQQADWIGSRLNIDPPWFDSVLYVMSLVLSLLMLKLVRILHRANSQIPPQTHRKPNLHSLADQTSALPLGSSNQNPKSKISNSG
ncbi:MAG: hypothetical protein QNJ46_31140 [Leptolyngbyaceae cyanobacterium MO_188.B28]|nr:hypothetical protein [Leptolyngbyaceae cyanobacterium MO_188.B28]